MAQRGPKPGTNQGVATFWNHVDKNGPTAREELGQCWMWTATKYRRGYGHATLFNRHMGAHRAAWILVNGFLHPRVLVCHHCDNPGCVRPEHLFVGTAKQNMADKYSKGRGRGPVGARNRNARLNDAAVIEIRRLASDGASYDRIANVLGLHSTTVSRAARGLSWRHIKTA